MSTTDITPNGVSSSDNSDVEGKGGKNSPTKNGDDINENNAKDWPFANSLDAMRAQLRKLGWVY